MSALTPEQERGVLRCQDCEHPHMNHGATGCGVGWPNTDDACRCPFGNRMLATIAALIAEAVDQARAEERERIGAAIVAERTECWLKHLAAHPFADSRSCPRCYAADDAYAFAARIARSQP